MLRWLKIFLLLTLVLSFSSATIAATVLTAMIKTPYFTVFYDPADPYLAESAAEAASDEFQRISKSLGYHIEPNRPMPLMVYRTHHTFTREGGHKDRYTVGTARSGDERISVDASGAFVAMKTVMAHEITHAVIFRILGNQAGALPLWVNEGLAKYESEPYPDPDNERVAEAASESTLIPLSNLRTSFPDKRVDLAYSQSASAVRFMVKEYGESAPKKLLAELAKSGSFDKALLKATGKTEDQFIDEWVGSISKRYRLLRMWKIASAFGGAIMSILVIVAFVIRRRRMAQAAREWEWEEFDDSMSRQLRDWPHR